MSSPWNSAVLAKYVALQVPGWILLVAVMYIGRSVFGYPSWVIWAALAGLLVKDAAVYPFIWRSFVRSVADAPEPRIGAVGVVEKDLSPVGYARFRGELWRARLASGEAPAAIGEKITVQGIEGLTLVVRREPPVS